MSISQELTYILYNANKENIHELVASFDEEKRKKIVDVILYSDNHGYDIETRNQGLVDFFRETREEQLIKSVEKYNQELIRGGDLVRMGLTVLSVDNYRKIFSLIPSNLKRSFDQFFEEGDELDESFYSIYGGDTVAAIKLVKGEKK